MTLSWTHPKSWRDLRAVRLLVTSGAGKQVGSVTVHPTRDRISGQGALRIVRRTTHVAHKGKTVRVTLGLRLARSLAGEDLAVHVQATDRRGRRQLERSAGIIRAP
jgi:hypothetical protein